MDHDQDIEQCVGTTRTLEAIKMMHFSKHYSRHWCDCHSRNDSESLSLLKKKSCSSWLIRVVVRSSKLEPSGSYSVFPRDCIGGPSEILPLKEHGVLMHLVDQNYPFFRYLPSETSPKSLLDAFLIQLIHHLDPG